MKTQVIGKPGRYSAAQGRANGVRAAGWSAATFLALVGAAALTVSAVISIFRGGTPVIQVVGALVLATAAHSVWRRAATLRVQAGRQQRGTAAEEQVVAALTKAGAALVINGAELHAGGDADHVVAYLRPGGHGVLAVIETKAGGGHVRMGGRRLLSGQKGRPIPGDPIAQVTRQADALRRIAGRPVAAIVCVPGMTSEPFAVGQVVVCGTRHLGRLLSHQLPEVALTTHDALGLTERVVIKA